ncbi:MAG: glycosyltransferase family 39 protein [bacterium]
MRSDRADLAVLAGLALAKLVFHLATSSGWGIFRDELYYLACADRLAWGYVDHPPLSIALLAAARGAFGDSLLAIRCLAAVAGAGSVFVTGLIARALGARRGGQVVAALATFFAPQFVAVSHFFSMNAFEVLFWALLEWLAVLILVHERPRLWVVFGVVAGLGLQNKLTVAVLVFGILVGLALTAQRRQLLSPWLWLGGALAAAILAPHLWWQAQHGWPTREFMANAAAVKNVHMGPLEFFLGQVTLAHPLAAPLWIAGLLGLWLAPRFTALRALGIAYVVAFALLVAQSGKVYYLTPIYPLMFAAGAALLDGAALRRRWRWPVPAAALAMLIGGLATVPLAIPVLSVDGYFAYARVIGISTPRMENNRAADLPQLLADMFGWTELADVVGRAADRLTPDERARAVVFAGNYGEAGAIEWFGPARRLPRVISPHNNYWLWGPGDLRATDPVLVIGGTPERLQALFESVELVETSHCTHCMPYENDLPIYLARGLREPIEQVWQKLKRFV